MSASLRSDPSRRSQRVPGISSSSHLKIRETSHKDNIIDYKPKKKWLKKRKKYLLLSHSESGGRAWVATLKQEKSESTCRKLPGVHRDVVEVDEATQDHGLRGKRRALPGELRSRSFLTGESPSREEAF